MMSLWCTFSYFVSLTFTFSYLQYSTLIHSHVSFSYQVQTNYNMFGVYSWSKTWGHCHLVYIETRRQTLNSDLASPCSASTTAAKPMCFTVRKIHRLKTSHLWLHEAPRLRKSESDSSGQGGDRTSVRVQPPLLPEMSDVFRCPVESWELVDV